MHRQSKVTPLGVVLVTSVTNPCASQNGHCCSTFEMGVRFISDVALSANRVRWMPVRGERNRSRQEQTRGRMSIAGSTSVDTPTEQFVTPVHL